MLRQISMHLTEDEFRALAKCAKHEHRTLGRQAAYLVADTLKSSGYLPLPLNEQKENDNGS